MTEEELVVESEAGASEGESAALARWLTDVTSSDWGWYEENE